MKSQQLTMEHYEEFEKYWKSQTKPVIINQLWEMYVHMQNLQNKIDALEEQAVRRNTDYLSRCRSSSGVTLPPGV